MERSNSVTTPNTCMKTTIRQKLFLISLTFLAGNGLLGYALYESNLKLLESEKWVQHTEQVINQSVSIQSLSKDMETATGGFVITKDKSFLETLYTSQKTVFVYLKQLRSLTADNPGQQKRVDSLNSYMQSYLEFSLKTVEIRKRQKLGSAMAYTAVKQGSHYTNRILQITLALRQEEEDLLKVRKQANKLSVAAFNRLSKAMFISLSGFTILLLIAISKYLYQSKEKGKRAEELVVANDELSFQNNEKEKRAAELVIANEELSYQNKEREKRAAELAIANEELSYQNGEKEQRAAELLIANQELLYQNKEKGARAAELLIANRELLYQNQEKENRAAELVVANDELLYQNQEKENRAAELVVANDELLYQNQEKENRAAELVVANNELSYQNSEKESRAAELAIANKELLYQNNEKGKRAAELAVANEELLYQNDEKEKRASELNKANRLYAFISQINQNILHLKDEEALFHNACRIAVEFGTFKIAWIGLLDSTNKKIAGIYQLGIPVEDIKQFKKVPLQTNGPLEYVLRTGRYYISNDILNEPELQGWKPLAVKQGICSCMILPINRAGKIIGTFNLYAAELNFFYKEEIALLEGLAWDISFALETFEKEKAHKKIQEQIIQNEKRFRVLIEKSADIITLSTAEGKLIYVSGSIKRCLGYSAKELLNTSVFNIIHPDDHPVSFENRDKLLQTPGKSFYYRHRRLHKNGSWIWCEGTLTNMLHEPGIYALVANFKDISERMLAEKNLLNSESSLKAAQTIAHIGNFAINLLDNSEVWSDQMYQILGVKKKPAPPAVPFSTFIHPDDLYAAREAFKSLRNASMDYRMVREDGAVRYVNSEWRFEFDKNKKPIGLNGVLQDITERKLAEIERTKMANDMMIRNAELEQFAYIISHNLRAPVANIIGASDAFNDPDLSLEDKDMLSKGINISVMKLDNVVKDLNHILEVKGEINDTKEIVHFSGLADDIKASIQHLVDKYGIEIKYDFSEISEFLTLRAYLYSIFYNLITNSIKYRRQQAHCIIEIKSCLEKNKLKIIFTDNGIGIDLEKNGGDVFGLYKRFNTNIEGKGMGLFMVKTQVEALGGKISLKSAENAGTEFTIEFEI